jgi:hypothetical protein
MDGLQLIPDKRQQPSDELPERQEAEPVSDAAFNQWLTHHLRRLYDPVTGEPLPADLIRALENRLK